MSGVPWNGGGGGGGGEESAYGRPRSSSRDSPNHSRHASGSRTAFPSEMSNMQRRPTLDSLNPVEMINGSSAYDEDRLAPLYPTGPTRKGRQRVDSLSSIGSSVAPVALPQHRTRRHASGQRPSSRENGAGPDVYLASYDSMQSGMSDVRHGSDSRRERSETTTSIGEGGLEAWLRSQAITTPNATTGNTKTSKRYDGMLDVQDALSDTGRSVGARSTGYRRNGTGSGRSKDKRRSELPEWSAAEGEAEPLGLGLGSAKRREASTGKGGLRDWLGAVDVDSQVPTERRQQQRRRELSAATMSASGVRLRESVRKINKPGREEQASLDALLSSTGLPRGGTMSASPSMGMLNVQPRSISNARGKRESIDVAERAAKKEAILGSPLRTWTKSMLSEQNTSISTQSTFSLAIATTVSSIVLISILVKWSVGLGSWSGRGRGPMFGDFEAQRHWIELTLHLPPSQWYFYDLPYWGLDYPPLTAHVSRWCGIVGTKLFPSLEPYFALHSSRGNEATALVTYMRATVLFFDVLVYTPAIFFFLQRKLQGRGRRTRSIAVLTVLLQPSLILIDFGHFQYNNVMLGLAAASFALLYTSLPNPDTANGGKSATTDMRERMKTLSRRVSFEYIAAAVFFSCSLCFKQMALYYAPAVFAVMLGRCVGLAKIGFERGLICFFGIALATSITFGVLFQRWLDDISQIAQVIHRIFPMARGLFEDKVSNVWCFLSVLPLPARYKLKNLLPISTLARLSLAVTLCAILLPCIHLFAAAAETVHIEMFLDEESKRQVLASEKRQAESGSVVGGSSISGRRPRYLSQAQKNPPPLSEIGSELASIAGGRSVRSSVVAGAQSSRTAGMTTSSLARIVVASTSPSPAASVLPYALLSTSLAFFLFGFQTHEKSILLPLLPMTLLMSVKGDEWGGGAGKTDWEWAVLMNNVAAFSMWPLLQRDGIPLQYFVVTVAWNWAIGYNPFAALWSARKSFIAWLSATVHGTMLFLHLLEVALPLFTSVADPLLTRYPDLFAVLNVLVSTPLFSVVWLWSIKRQLEVGFACGIDVLGLQNQSAAEKRKKQQQDALEQRKTK